MIIVLSWLLLIVMIVFSWKLRFCVKQKFGHNKTCAIWIHSHSLNTVKSLETSGRF